MSIGKLKNFNIFIEGTSRTKNEIAKGYHSPTPSSVAFWVEDIKWDCDLTSPTQNAVSLGAGEVMAHRWVGSTEL